MFLRNRTAPVLHFHWQQEVSASGLTQWRKLCAQKHSRIIVSLGICDMHQRLFSQVLFSRTHKAQTLIFCSRIHLVILQCHVQTQKLLKYLATEQATNEPEKGDWTRRQQDQKTCWTNCASDQKDISNIIPHQNCAYVIKFCYAADQKGCRNGRVSKTRDRLRRPWGPGNHEEKAGGTGGPRKTRTIKEPWQTWGENVVLILRRLFLTIMPQTGVLRRNSGCRGHSAKSNLFPRDANRDLCHKPTVWISSAPTVDQWNVIARINVSFLKHILYHMFYIVIICCNFRIKECSIYCIYYIW